MAPATPRTPTARKAPMTPNTPKTPKTPKTAKTGKMVDPDADYESPESVLKRKVRGKGAVEKSSLLERRKGEGTVMNAHEWDEAGQSTFGSQDAASAHMTKRQKLYHVRIDPSHKTGGTAVSTFDQPSRLNLTSTTSPVTPLPPPQTPQRQQQQQLYPPRTPIQPRNVKQPQSPRNPTQPHAFHPYILPSPFRQSQHAFPPSYPDFFSLALESQRPRLPPPPHYLYGPEIDALTHTLWNLMLMHGSAMNRACSEATKYPEAKLRALARLNLLPSWVWLRETVVINGLRGLGRVLVDREMEGMAEEAEGLEARRLDEKKKVYMEAERRGMVDVAQVEMENAVNGVEHGAAEQAVAQQISKEKFRAKQVIVEQGKVEQGGAGPSGEEIGSEDHAEKMVE